MPANNRIPQLTNFKGYAVAYIGGKKHYFGKFDDPESRVKFQRFLAGWLMDGQPSLADAPPTGGQADYEGAARQANEVSIAQLCALWAERCNEYYRKDGAITREAEMCIEAAAEVDALYSDQSAAQFGPLKFQVVRERMVEKGLSRGVINKHMGRIRRMFKWAASRELTPAHIWHELQAVADLAKGRSKARELPPVPPAPEADVQKTLPELTQVLADMVRLQRVTGMRPGEICQLRPCDVNREAAYDPETDQAVWSFTPESHKTEHHGIRRVIPLGPKAQQILAPYLLRGAEEFCFSPAESEKQFRESKAAARVTPINTGNRAGKSKTGGKRRPGKQYNSGSYRRAVHRACDRAGVDRWSPNQLRHSAGTELRAMYEDEGEAARLILGHKSVQTTQIYAERDMKRAFKIAAQVG